MIFFVTKELYAERYALCKACPEFIPLTKQCRLCQCFMPIKAKFSRVACPMTPVPKWGRATAGNSADIPTIED